ncbi:expressed protein [Batrachochytrium dendrobatidis JAM81]|uniref:Expressed protein n=2 Tax=Batrachochytrium dendrobatidis TaxID=109871 RepID=F4PEH1_BATDJ|nr:uncharacterized protein BATDEDRAFT_36285 [Batrachochytrium dendrobatidis JAM81]EGF76373.1 expressed protein [Batrachochytrium dendrobatidis JAM81]KAK5672341.1 hypothetical protein QVD99_001109 [Batrachochytrium dendrobatidis]OAJ45384.1 hypothetical protein BDEG_28527 [Batrachochytrium dendrobatidis JEL423]|eukprot:XP_006682990.1 expressed protein [Batrachochytrium dendrobatidis JAM81]
MFVSNAILLLSIACTVSASWQRRVYYTDNSCKANFGYGVQVWVPNAPCSSPASVTTSCEIKSTDSRALSSEGTACDNQPATDNAYVPSSSDAALVPGANYLSVNVYNNAPNQQPCFFDPTVQVEQTTYAADGKCYAFESGYYFKASCSGTSGQVQFCNDAECKDCKPGGPSFDSGSCQVGTGLPTRMICSGSNTSNPLTPVNTTAAAPSSAAAATGAATAAAGATVSPASSTHAASAKSAATESQAQLYLTAILTSGSLLAALYASLV